MATTRKKPAVRVERIASTEAIDFDAWAIAYVSAVLEAEGYRVPQWSEAA